MSRIIRYLIIVLLLIFHSAIHCQPVKLQFKHITPDDGLSSSTVKCFLKDHKGFMWIGTYYGLNKYDGYQFTIYNNILSDSNSLSHNLIYHMYEDKENNFWIGTQDGLSRYDSRKDNFINYMHLRSSTLYGLECNILKITEDSANNLWLASNQGLIQYNKKSEKVIRYNHDPKNPSSISYNDVEDVFIDSKYRMWVSTRRGLNLFQPNTKTFLRVPVSKINTPELLNTYFTNIVEDKEGNLWFGTFGSGLYCLPAGETNLDKFISYHHKAEDKNSLSADRILSLRIDHAGNLWIGVENGGLNLFDKQNKKFWHYRADFVNPNSLNNESIYAIYEDEQNTLWIGTYAGGINITKYESGAILAYANLPGVENSLSHNSVTSFYEDKFGRILIGTDGGGLNIFDLHTNEFSHFNSKNSNLISDAILSIVQDENERIWIGTWGGGMLEFDLNTKSFKSLNTGNSKIPDNNIFSIVVDKKGILWLGSFQNGLIRYNKKTNTFKNFTSQNSNLSFSMLTTIKQLADGRLIIGTPSGLNVFDPEKERFKSYFHLSNNNKSISSDGIHSIEIENDTTIWIGTDKGINKFNPKTEIFTHYLIENGLPDNVIKGLTLDSQGKLWASTNKGICRCDFNKNEFKIFTKSNRLQSNEFNDRSVLKLRDGSLLFGGTKGFNLIYPNKIKENKNVPKVLITDFLVFNKSVHVSSLNSPLSEHITETDELNLSYDQSVITFQFAALDFTAPEKNQYAYMMEGFEKDWNYVGELRSATYTNLDPGDYIFRVKASNNDGVWNESGTSLKITVNPPFWRAAWFRILFLIIIIGLAFSIYKRRTARMMKINRELEIRVAQRTSQLEAAIKELEAFSYSISHDLRAPLRAIDGYSKIFLEDFGDKINSEGHRLLSVISTNSKKMGHLITDLLEFSHVGRAALRANSMDMHGLVQSALSELLTAADRERYEIIVHRLPEAIGDQILIRQVWVNLISNAIKFSSKKEKPRIEIGGQETEKENTYFIIDNGAGFNQQYVQKLFGVFRRLHREDEFVGTGVGLAIVQRIVTRHDGRVWAVGEVDKGASFYFTLPSKGISKHEE